MTAVVEQAQPMPGGGARHTVRTEWDVLLPAEAQGAEELGAGLRGWRRRALDVLERLEVLAAAVDLLARGAAELVDQLRTLD